MAEYAKQGDAACTLMEECAEVIQIIAKLKRFGGRWDEVPPGKDKTRWEMLQIEMNDVLLAWDILQEVRDRATDPYLSWDGDASHSE